jgi:ElaB/YqjD/DUF883 family membrane-anchored ribosome-binding protein
MADDVPKSEASAELEQFAQDAKREADKALTDGRAFLQRQWNERPLTTAAVAIGLGALIGLALSKRR